MFEEVLEEILNKHCNCELLPECIEGTRIRCSDFEEKKKLLLEGIELVYNKANEWHYVKDGDLPKGDDAVLIYWKSGNVKCASVVEPYKVTEDTHIIAWKEIVLPNLNKIAWEGEK